MNIYECIGFAVCQHFIHNNIRLDHSGSFDLAERWCSQCIDRTLNDTAIIDPE